MKKIISLLITLFIISETAFAFSQDDLDKSIYNSYKPYENEFTNAVTVNGEPLLDYIDETKIIPEYTSKYDRYEVYQNYTEGNFRTVLESEVSGYFCKLKDSENVIYAQLDYSRRFEDPVLKETSGYFPVEFAFDNNTVPQMLSEVGVNNVTDIFFGAVDGRFCFLYLNTDKGEFIIPWYIPKNLKEFDNVKTPEKYKLLKLSDFFEYDLEYLKYIDELRAQREAEERRKEQSETRWVLQDGEAIKITPVPTKAPVVTAEPETTPKPVIDITPKPTVTPDVTPKPTVEPTTVPTEKPQTDKTLTVRTRGRITITIDTDEVEFPDAQPFVDENDRTQVPIRTVAEMLNSTVLWDNETRTVTITNKNGDVIALIIDSPVMSVNGKSVYMDTQATIRDNRTYIPVRFIAGAMNMTVKWGD